MLCLALEISPTRALAQYCYVPFNLKHRAHQLYLASVARNGKLYLEFVAGRKIISRTYELSPAQREQLTETHRHAMEALATCENYNFSEVVQDFEKTIRISQFFYRAASEEEVSKTVDSLRAKANDLPAEKQVLAHRIVRDFADILNNRYGDKVREFVAQIPAARNGLLTLFDYLQDFSRDYNRFVDCVGDHIAVNTADDALKTASDWPRKLELILRILDDANTSAEEKQKANAEFVAGIGRALDYVSRGRGLSIALLQGIVLPLRALLPAQPGRPVEDYSREYGLKASGLSWSEVAAKHHEENTAVRAEFGGGDYILLTFEQKETLKNRVREGVRSHAERTGQPFPVPEPLS